MEKQLGLSVPLKIYIYALHGCAAEVIYTALWDLFSHYDIKLAGNSHIWALFIYGVSCYVIECASSYLRDTLKIPLLIRALIYTIWTFCWEFATGFALRQIGACPWDYEPWFNWHVMGLITLEYTPFWYFGAIFVELILVKWTNMLVWRTDENVKGRQNMTKNK